MRQFVDTAVVDFEGKNKPKDLMKTYFFDPLEKRFSSVHKEKETKTTVAHYRDLMDLILNSYFDDFKFVNFSNHSRDAFVLDFSAKILPIIITFIQDRLNSYQNLLKEINVQAFDFFQKDNDTGVVDDINPIKAFLNWLKTQLHFKHDWLKEEKNNATELYDNLSRWSKGENIPKRALIFDSKDADHNDLHTSLQLHQYVQKLNLTTSQKAKLILMLEEFFFLARASAIILDDLSQISSSYAKSLGHKFDFKSIVLLYLQNPNQSFQLKLKDTQNPELLPVTIHLNHLLIENKAEIGGQKIIIEERLSFFKEQLKKQPNHYDQINYHLFQGIYQIYTYQFKDGIENISQAYELSEFTGHPRFNLILKLRASLYSLHFLFEKELDHLRKIKYAGLYQDSKVAGYHVTEITRMQKILNIYILNTVPLENDIYLQSSKERRSKSHILEDIDIYHYQQFFIDFFYAGKFENQKIYLDQVYKLFEHIKNSIKGLVEIGPEITYDLSKPNKIMYKLKRYTSPFVALLENNKQIFQKLIQPNTNLDHLSSDNESILQFALQFMDPEDKLLQTTDPFWFSCLKNKKFKLETICAVTSKKRHTPLGHAINSGKIDVVKSLFHMYLQNEEAHEHLSYFCNQKFSTDEISPLYKVISLIQRYKSIQIPYYPNNERLAESVRRHLPNVDRIPMEYIDSPTSFDLTRQRLWQTAQKNYQLSELRAIAKYLLENNANPNQEHNPTGLEKYTPFHMAIEADEADLIKLMIEKYDVNYQERIWVKNQYSGYQQYDALHLAYNWNAKEVLNYFQTLQWD